MPALPFALQLAQELPQPSPPQELQSLLGHPLILGFGALLAAWIASRVVHEQVRRMGLEREDDPQAFGWTALFSALSFWAVLALGLVAIAAKSEMLVVGKFLQTAFDLLLRALLAGGILAATATAARSLFQGEPEGPRRAERRRSLLVLGGVVAVLAAVGLSLGLWFLLGTLGIFVYFLIQNEGFRGRVTGAFEDFRAGGYLGKQFKKGDEITGAQRSLKVAGPFGTFRTWIREGDQRRLVRNRTLLALTEETPEVPVLPTTEPGDDDASA